jgi:2'-5' RNA ligase
MRPGDRLVCSFVNNQERLSTFKDWPLHITIVPWFRIELDSSTFASTLSRCYIGSEPFTILVQEEATFGYKKHKTVNLVSAPRLFRLEGQTRRFLHTHHAWIVDEADHTRRFFRPHVTVQQSARTRSGDQFQCDRLYVISQQGQYKQIDEIMYL